MKIILAKGVPEFSVFPWQAINTSVKLYHAATRDLLLHLHLFSIPVWFNMGMELLCFLITMFFPVMRIREALSSGQNTQRTARKMVSEWDDKILTLSGFTCIINATRYITNLTILVPLDFSPSRAHSRDSLAIVKASIWTPFAMSSGDAYSSGLWLYPAARKIC